MQYDKDNNKQNDQLEAEGYEVLSNDKDRREDTAETMASAAGVAPDAIAEGLANVRIESREQTAQPDEAANDEESSSDSEIEWVQIAVPVYKNRRHGGRGGRHHRGPPGFGPMGLGPMPPFHPWAHHGMGRPHGKHGHGKGSRHHRAHSPSDFKSGGGRSGKGCHRGRHSDKNDKDDFQVVTDEESSGTELPPTEGEVPFPPPPPGHHGHGHGHHRRGPFPPGGFPFDSDSTPFPFPPHFGGHGMGRGRGGFGGRTHHDLHGHHHGHHHGPGSFGSMPSFGFGHPHAFGSHAEAFPEFFVHGHPSFGGRGRHHHFHGFMGPFCHRGGPTAVPQDEVPE